ncbi:MAG TPA: head GIN domain-containing protein [Casimicrobiaceae bacterium]
MPRSSLPWLILATVLVSAALAWWTLTRIGASGHRPMPIAHRDLAPFHEIEVGGTARVTLAQGDSEAIEVDAPGRGVLVDADVSRGRLVVTAHDRRRWWGGLLGGRRQSEPAGITIRFRTLDAIAVGGTVKLRVPALTASSLRIQASGGSAVTIDDLRATSLRVDGSGALQAELAGRVEDETVSISGAGSYRADRLHASDVTVSVSGVGNVLIHAERTLRASISGAGVIEYIGDPKVTEHVSGIGRVKRREAAPASGMRVALDRAVPPDLRADRRGFGDQWSASTAAVLKNSGARVSGSMSSWTPGTTRTSATRQSRMSACSISATSAIASYG